MSVQTTEIDQISWRSVASLLVRAFFCSILNMVILNIGILLFAFNGQGNLFGRGSGNYSWAALGVFLTILLFGPGFIPFKIHPEAGQKRFLAVLSASFIWSVGFAWEFPPLQSNIFFGKILLWTALMSFLVVGKQVKTRLDWIGLALALLFGVGLDVGNALHENGMILMPMWPRFFSEFTAAYFLSPVWLSMAFFPELLRFRAGWKGAVVGFVLWVILGLLSFWVFNMIFSIIFG